MAPRRVTHADDRRLLRPLLRSVRF
jgi:hypothetical protein